MKKYQENRAKNWNWGRDEFENQETPSEYLATLKSYKDMITMDSSSTLTGDQSKHDDLGSLTVPTKPVNDVPRSFQVTRQSERNKDNGLKGLERTSSANFGTALRTTITQSEAILEALSMTRKDQIEMSINKHDTTSVKTESSSSPSPAESDSEVSRSVCREVSGPRRSRARTRKKKYRRNIENATNTRREIIRETKFSPPPQIDLNLPQIRRIMQARRKLLTRQYITAHQKCPSLESKPEEPSIQIICEYDKSFQNGAPNLKPRPPWNASCAPIRPPKPILLQPYFKSLLLAAGMKFEGLSASSAVPLIKSQRDPPNECRNSPGQSTPKAWEKPRDIPNSYGESISDSQDQSATQTGYPRSNKLIGSMEPERGAFRYPQYNSQDKPEEEINQKSQIWPGGFVDKFGGQVPATRRSPQLKPKSNSGRKTTHHRLIPVRGYKDRPRQIPQPKISGDTTSQSRYDLSCRTAKMKQSVHNEGTTLKTRRKKSNKVSEVNGNNTMPPEVVTRKNAHPTKVSLAKRISQTAVTWFKHMSGSKSGLEKIEVPLPSQSPPPLPRPRRKRLTIKEVVENSERIRLGLPSSERQTTGKMIDRVEESLNLTRHVSKVVLHEGDPDVETIYVAPKIGVFKRLFSNHNMSKPELTTKNAISEKVSTERDKKGVALRFWEGIKRSSQNKGNRISPKI